MVKEIVNQIQHFFGISRKEARAALVLMIFSFCLLWTPFIFRRWVLPLIPVPKTEINTQKLDSIVADLQRQADDPEPERVPYKSGSKKAPARPVRLFPFDPNEASTEQMEELGIPAFLAKRIEKYRSKGGKFRKKEDLLHIYDFPGDLYIRLQSYITLKGDDSGTAEKKIASSPPSGKFETATYSKETKVYAKPVLAPFDINTADTTQLIKLKGIGSKLSVRILKFRDGLGGFHSVDQFQEIFGLDSFALSELNKFARVNTPVRKININSATVEELSSHSYLRNKKLATVIVNYRDQHGPYSSAEDLRKVRILDEKTIEKITPYLAF
jgi:competence protein ComEA